MRPLIVSKSIQDKLRDKHNISVREVEQCFENRIGEYLEDTRVDHKTNPPTLWFVAETNCGKLLKVIFMFIDGNVHLKSAFEADQNAIRLYNEFAR